MPYNGSPTPLTGTALLIVNVVDVDDERPQFLSATYSFLSLIHI